jgi:type I restriction enzyme, S subunit
MNFVGLDNVVLNVNSWNPVRDGDEQLICYIDLSSIDQQSKTINANESIVAKEAPSRARQLVKRGDVLVSTVRPNLNGVAMVDEFLDGATASTGFCVLRPNQDKLDGSYLFHWVKSSSFVSSMVQQATGASYPAVSDRIVKGSKILLPPIDQQKRIAAILDKAEELRSLRRQSIEQLDILGRSIFIEMFGDPVMNPKHIPVVKLGELTKIGTGGTPSRKISENFGGDIPWVKTTEVNSYLITNTEERITEIALKNSNCRIYPVGSIIIAMYGQGKTRGQCAVLGIEASTNQACAVLTPNTRYRTNFLFSQIAMSYSRLRSIARGGNQENLNLSLISDFEVLLPSLKFQDEFAQRIEAIEHLKSQHRESLAQLDKLFASLQHRAFRGEL